jgi:hypothetical protein
LILLRASGRGCERKREEMSWETFKGLAASSDLAGGKKVENEDDLTRSFGIPSFL